MSSLVAAMGKSRQNGADWLARQDIQYSDKLPVRVGKGNVKATAYPLPKLLGYVQYLAERGEPQAIALYHEALATVFQWKLTVR